MFSAEVPGKGFRDSAEIPDSFVRYEAGLHPNILLRAELKAVSDLKPMFSAIVARFESSRVKALRAMVNAPTRREAATRKAVCGGGAHLAFDMIDGARDPNSTLAALGSPHRQGRLVLLGSSMAPVPIDSMLMMFSLEIIGNCVHPHNAYLGLLRLLG
jgi:hypothetical protein